MAGECPLPPPPQHPWEHQSIWEGLRQDDSIENSKSKIFNKNTFDRQFGRVCGLPGGVAGRAGVIAAVGETQSLNHQSAGVFVVGTDHD